MQFYVRQVNRDELNVVISTEKIDRLLQTTSDWRRGSIDAVIQSNTDPELVPGFKINPWN